MPCRAVPCCAMLCCVVLLAVMHQAETPSRKELELFLKEVQTLAKLHHRNIVQFYGACLEMGSMFFVTELMKVCVGVRVRAAPSSTSQGCDARAMTLLTTVRYTCSSARRLPALPGPEEASKSSDAMCVCVSMVVLQGGDLYSALRHHAETMKWERLGRKVALDVALGLNYLHAQVNTLLARVFLFMCWFWLRACCGVSVSMYACQCQASDFFSGTPACAGGSALPQ